MSRDSWFFTVLLCVKSKFEKSYKDIPDEKFTEVVEYIDFLKKNPSWPKNIWTTTQKCWWFVGGSQWL